jgi:hypothetical protein
LREYPETELIVILGITEGLFAARRTVCVVTQLDVLFVTINVYVPGLPVVRTAGKEDPVIIDCTSEFPGPHHCTVEPPVGLVKVPVNVFIPVQNIVADGTGLTVPVGHCPFVNPENTIANSKM